MRVVLSSLDDESRRRVQEILLRFRQLTLLLDAEIDRIGVPELRRNRVIQVLTQLRSDGRTRPRDLQGSVGLTSGGLTKLIDRMCALELVERVDRGGAGDGRSVTVRLTPGGRRALRRVRRAVDDAHDDCRVVAKEVVQLAEALGPRQPVASSVSTDLLAALANLGTVTLASVGHSDEISAHDEYFALLTLCSIDLHEPCRPGALIDVLGLTSGGVTKMLDRLEHHGLISRVYGGIEGDRRAVLVLATPAGRNRIQADVEAFAEHLDETWTVMRWVAEGIGPRD